MLLEFLNSTMQILWIVVGITMLGALASLPLGFFRRKRGLVAKVLFASSIVLSLAIWMWGLLVTWLLSGGWVVLIGLFIFYSIGVIPLGMIAAAVHSEWTTFWYMGVAIAVAVATHAFSRWLLARSD